MLEENHPQVYHEYVKVTHTLNKLLEALEDLDVRRLLEDNETCMTENISRAGTIEEAIEHLRYEAMRQEDFNPG